MTPGAWAKSPIVRTWIALAVIAGAVTTFVIVGHPAFERSVTVERPIIEHPIIQRSVTLQGVKGANGIMTDVRCASVPRAATYGQVVQAYGWPQKAYRNKWSLAETDGNELDYPLLSHPLSDGSVRLCAVVFVHGRVDHVWEDLP